MNNDTPTFAESLYVSPWVWELNGILVQSQSQCSDSEELWVTMMLQLTDSLSLASPDKDACLVTIVIN